MKIKLIKKDEGISRKISNSYEVKNLVTKDTSNKISLAISNAKEHSEITKNKRSDRIYYILKGRLIVKEKDNELIADKGDAIFIPANTNYIFKGTFKAILINSPTFNPNDEKIQSSK